MKEHKFSTVYDKGVLRNYRIHTMLPEDIEYIYDEEFDDLVTGLKTNNDTLFLEELGKEIENRLLEPVVESSLFFIRDSSNTTVADGVQFPCGKCVLCWRGNVNSVVVHDNIENVKKIHCVDKTFRWAIR